MPSVSLVSVLLLYNGASAVLGFSTGTTTTGLRSSAILRPTAAKAATPTSSTKLYGYDEEYAKYFPLEPDESFEPRTSSRPPPPPQSKPAETPFTFSYLQQLEAPPPTPPAVEEETVVSMSSTSSSSSYGSPMSYLESLSHGGSGSDHATDSHASTMDRAEPVLEEISVAVVEEEPERNPEPEIVMASMTVQEPSPPLVTPASSSVPSLSSVRSTLVPLERIVDSSPTLSASSPTISITLPLALQPPKVGKSKNIEYGERSRTYRRTVFTHDDWVRHRSPDRFVRNLASIGNSGIYKNIAFEVLAMTLFTAGVMTYNGLVTGYTDVAGINYDPAWSSPFLPPLTLPTAAFSLTSPSLGLLLAFRTDTAYQRWDEARKNWGMNINHTRDLVRMGNAYYDRTGVSDDQRKADLQHLSLCTWAFVRSMKRHLSPEAEDEASFKAELYERLPKEQAQKIIKAAHRPNRALYDLSLAIENMPMHFLRKNEMHAALTIFEDNLGSSERLLTSPVPLIYNRHTARFLFVWILGLPFALWEPFGFMWNHIGMLPVMTVLSLMLFGIEELATQMEEPFTILPMQVYCDKIGSWCNEIAAWEDGDNGVTTNRSYQGRSEVLVEGINGGVPINGGGDYFPPVMGVQPQ